MPSNVQDQAIVALAALGRNAQQIATVVGVEVGDVESVLGGGTFNPPGVPLSGGGSQYAVASFSAQASQFQGSKPGLSLPKPTGIGGSDGGVSVDSSPVVIEAGGGFGDVRVYSPFDVTFGYVELAVWNADFSETLVISSVNPIVVPGDGDAHVLASADFDGGNFWQTGADLSGPGVTAAQISSAAGGLYACRLHLNLDAA